MEMTRCGFCHKRHRAVEAAHVAGVVRYRCEDHKKCNARVIMRSQKVARERKVPPASFPSFVAGDNRVNIALARRGE